MDVDETEYVSSTRVFRRGLALFRRLLGFFRPNVWPKFVSPSYVCFLCETWTRDESCDFERESVNIVCICLYRSHP
ncbi:hypothetical protein HanIR_Chr16g0805361 [Helianthus annuus]|nr:hypothetical protein HanIR_Chr16g0805361 [Helianthus annuus]